MRYIIENKHLIPELSKNCCLPKTLEEDAKWHYCEYMKILFNDDKNDEYISNLLNEASDKIDQNEYQTALELINKVIEIDPLHPKAIELSCSLETLSPDILFQKENAFLERFYHAEDKEKVILEACQFQNSYRVMKVVYQYLNGCN